MNWKKWILIAVLAADAVATVSLVGGCVPISPGRAALTVLFNGLLIWLIVTI